VYFKEIFLCLSDTPLWWVVELVLGRQGLLASSTFSSSCTEQIDLSCSLGLHRRSHLSITEFVTSFLSSYSPARLLLCLLWCSKGILSRSVCLP